MQKLFQAKTMISLLCLVTCLSACKKDKNEVATNSTVSPAPTASTDPGPPHLNANVHIMDSAKYILDTSAALLNSGNYNFSFTGTTPTIKAGDVILGIQAGGFIRKVIAANPAGGNLNLLTLPGKMSDVFGSGAFNFDADLTGMPGSSSVQGFSYLITNKTIYTDQKVNFVINSGRIDFNPLWNFYFEFTTKGLNKFEMISKAGNLNEELNTSITVAYDASAQLPPADIIIRKLSKRFVKWISSDNILVPVPIQMDIDLIYHYEGYYEDSSSSVSGFNLSSTLSTNIKNSKNQWSGGNGMYVSHTFTTSTFNKNSLTHTIFTLIPKTKIYFYGTEAINLEAKPQAEIEGSGSLNYIWNYETNSWVETTAEIEPTIFDYSVSHYSKTLTGSKNTYKAPASIEIAAGLNQTGPPLSELPIPIKIKVKDSKDTGVEGVLVYFNKSSGASLSNSSGKTDKDGFVQTKWTLGPYGDQQLYITIPSLNNTPSIITASITN